MPSSIPEVFDTGPAIKKEMLRLIASARDYILLNSFLLAIDPATSDVMNALGRKHRARVKVYVLLGSSSRHMPGGKEAFRFFDEAGIPMVE
jgi:phosphatidylserine/phosphatidylglycerophosphate/cardiolipin synthase-like enzyme